MKQHRVSKTTQEMFNWIPFVLFFGWLSFILTVDKENVSYRLVGLVWSFESQIVARKKLIGILDPQEKD